MTPPPDRPPTVLTTLPLTPGQRQRLLGSGVDRVVVGRAGAFEPADLAAADIWLGPGLTAVDFAAAPGLRWVQAVSAGVDSYLFPDLVASDVILTNARGLHAAAVADHAMLLVLAFARRLPTFIRQQDRHEWQPDPDLRRLEGTRMLIVGVGAIGDAIAARAIAFGIDVRGVRRSAGTGTRALPFPTVDTAHLDDELPNADWIVLALPLTEQTRHIVGPQQLEAMSPTAVLVNIGRGALVDETALVEALQSGSIAGACLDVFEREPLPADSPLWSMPNVIVTPHQAGDTADLPEREIDVFLDNLRRYLDGAPLRNVIDHAAGY